MDEKKMEIVEIAFDLAFEMTEQMRQREYRLKEVHRENYHHFSIVFSTRNYMHALSYHMNLIKGFTRSMHWNSSTRRFLVETKAEIIAQETGANIEDVRSFLYSRLGRFLVI